VQIGARGAVLSHKQKKVQGKASAICFFAVLICAVCVCRGVVEVVALLGFIQRGLCCSGAVRAIVDQVAAAIKDKPGPFIFRMLRERPHLGHSAVSSL
jgi:hypothetical protein